MRVVIEDTWFPAGTKIRIGRGSDELIFLRCTFEGGEIAIEPEVDREIFSRCVFQQTRFTGQALSARIAAGCTSASIATEASAPRTSTPYARFRR